MGLSWSTVRSYGIYATLGIIACCQINFQRHYASSPKPSHLVHIGRFQQRELRLADQYSRPGRLRLISRHNALVHPNTLHLLARMDDHETRIPNPATASIPDVKLTFAPSIGEGLVVLDPGGGAGSGAEGGGAGGPNPTTGIPRSSSGSAELLLGPLRPPDREPGRGGGRGERARSGRGVASSLSSDRVGVSNLRPLKDETFDGAEWVCDAKAATLLADREGFIPRMGTARPSRGPVELRTDWRKGA